MTTDVAIAETELDLVHLSPLICMELAAGLSSVEGVKKKYNITEEQWLRLKDNPTFRKMMLEANKTFAGDLNAGKRIEKKAEILLEEALPILHRMMTSHDSSATTVIDTVKQLKEMAGFSRKNGGNGSGVGPGFNVQIEIHTGNDEVVIQGN